MLKQQVFFGYVSLYKDTHDRWYVRATSNPPKKRPTLVGFIKVVGCRENPQKEWKSTIIEYDHKSHDYYDGYFYSNPGIEVLGIEGICSFGLGRSCVDVVVGVELFDNSLVSLKKMPKEDVSKALLEMGKAFSKSYLETA